MGRKEKYKISKRSLHSQGERRLRGKRDIWLVHVLVVMRVFFDKLKEQGGVEEKSKIR